MAQKEVINMIKNIVITALLAAIAFLLLGDGTGVVSLQQFGMPVFIMVLGVMVSMMAKGSTSTN